MGFIRTIGKSPCPQCGKNDCHYEHTEQVGFQRIDSTPEAIETAADGYAGPDVMVA